MVLGPIRPSGKHRYALLCASKSVTQKRGLADGKKGGGDEVHLERRWDPGKCSKFLGSGVSTEEAEKSLHALVKKDWQEMDLMRRTGLKEMR